MMMPPAAPVETVGTALADFPIRRRSTQRQARVALRRRLWDLTEVTAILNRCVIPGERPRFTVQAVRDWIVRGDLPAVCLPSVFAADMERPGWRTYRVPDAWISSWFAMRDKSDPIWTERSDLGSPADPPWLSVVDAALAVAVSHTTMHEIVNLGFVSASTAPTGAVAVATRRLDDWVFELIEHAETKWYGRARPEDPDA